MTTRLAQMRPSKAALALAVAAIVAVPASAQKSLTAPNVPNVEDFTGFLGTGFAPEPEPGELDSDAFAVSGFDEPNAGTDGACNFGDTCPTDQQAASSDFSRGLITGGGQNAGGIFAMDHGGGDVGMGVQMKADDFTPGDITIKYRNDTGEGIEEMEVTYDVWLFNSEDGIGSWGFSYATGACDGTGDSYTVLESLGFASPEDADVVPIWESTPFAAFITLDEALPAGNCFFARFTGDAVKKPNSQDEIAIDDVVVTPIKEIIVETCPQSAMYWLEHPDAWPVDELSVAGRQLGKDELLRILRHSTGQPLRHLARQLVAAKLNLAAGVDGGDVGRVLEAADAFLMMPNHDGRRSRRHTTRRRAARLTRILFAFNNMPCETPDVADDGDSLRLDEANAAHDENVITNGFAIDGNYPNPFDGMTTIQFRLTEATPVRLVVYDALSREVTTLVNEMLQEGVHVRSFTATDLPSGIYFTRMTTPRGMSTHKMVIRR